MIIDNYEYNSTIFNLDFQNKINFLVDNSGTGKTFLMQMLKFYCDDNNISCTHVDYIHKDMPLGDSKVLLFDRADLYFTDGMLSRLKNLDSISIISMKDTSDLDMYGDIGLYRLINTGTEITSKRWG